MATKLTDEQRKIRNRERTARLFARYKHTGTEERGNPEAWKASAHAMINGSSPAQDLATLGISQAADAETLKRAYRDAMRRAHPDVGGDHSEAAKINEAYARLAEVFKSQPITKTTTEKGRRDTGLRAQLLNPIERSEAEVLLRDDAWGLQEKMDGHHVIIEIRNNTVVAANKQGLETQIPADLAAELSYFDNFTFDGELVGGEFFVFDLLEMAGTNLRTETYLVRYNALHSWSTCAALTKIKVVPLITGTTGKTAAFESLRAFNKEGGVFKRLAARWSEGRPHSGGDMLKHKFVATLSAIVDDIPTGKNSIHIFVWRNNGAKMPLGRCTIPGGRPTPPSGSIVEIRYLYCVENLVQPCFLGIRNDVLPAECTENQIKYKA